MTTGRHKDHLSPQLTPFDSSLLPSDSDNNDGHRHLTCWRPGWRNENWAVWECWALGSSCRNPYPPLAWDSGSSSGFLQAMEPKLLLPRPTVPGTTPRALQRGARLLIQPSKGLHKPPHPLLWTSARYHLQPVAGKEGRAHMEPAGPGALNQKP